MTTDRRSYWIEQMEAGYAFMQQILRDPVQECGEPVERLQDAVRVAGAEVAFSSKPHVNNLPRLFLLRKSLIAPFLEAAREMNQRGWVLKVEDAYRSTAMQAGLMKQPYVFDVVFERLRWECRGAAPTPELMSRRLAALTAASPKVGTHMSGSAMDISVLDRDTGAELDRGGPYLELSELTPMDSPFISAPARANRRAITELMQRHGFMAYPWEFWHYNQGDAYDERLNRTGKPGRYGAVHVNLSDGRVTPIQNPTEPLYSLEEIAAEVALRVARLPA